MEATAAIFSLLALSAVGLAFKVWSVLYWAEVEREPRLAPDFSRWSEFDEFDPDYA